MAGEQMNVPPMGSAVPASALAGADGGSSAVSWAAIFAGAAVATATSLLLVLLGLGFGFTSISAWQNTGATAGAFAVGAAIWLIIVQWLSSGLGGYLTGRLRTKWTGTHTQEVFFRDTAHGFVAWSVATLVTVTMIASAGSALVGGGLHAASNVVGGAAQGLVSSTPLDPNASFVDRLFRPTTVSASGNPADAKAEASRILVSSIGSGSLSAPDRTYLAQLAASRTGISQQDAEKRVDDLMSQAKAAADKARETADQARKEAAKLAFYTFFSMLIGAFVASAAAAYGGSQRDEW